MPDAAYIYTTFFGVLIFLTGVRRLGHTYLACLICLSNVNDAIKNIRHLFSANVEWGL